MNKLYLFFLLITFSTCTFASWEPFPLNQKSYYSYNNWSGTMINSVYMDTIVQRTNYQAIFFNHKYYGNSHEHCYSTIVNTNQPVPVVGYTGQMEFDSLVILGDTLFYTPQFSTPQYLLLNPSIGQSWPFMTYTVTYTADSVMQIFGVTDSVKLFTGLPNSTIILSKNHGYISYPRFNTSTLEMHTLAGFSDQSGTYGFIKPTYLDFFPYQPGDKRFWKFGQEPPFSVPIYNYRIDSITAVNFAPDTISIYFDYIWYNNDTVIYNSSYEKYEVNYLMNTLEAPTNWLTIATPYLYYNSIYLSQSYLSKTDSSIDYSYFYAGHTLDTTNCTVFQGSDIGDLYIYNTFQGITEISSDVFYPVYQRLLGSIINGVARGDTSVTIGIDKISLSIIGASPNPATDYFKLISHENLEGADYSIFNITGQKIQTGKIYSYKLIDVRELNKGIYFLRVMNGTKSGSVRFMKQ